MRSACLKVGRQIGRGAGSTSPRSLNYLIIGACMNQGKANGHGRCRIHAESATFSPTGGLPSSRFLGVNGKLISAYLSTRP